MVELPDIDDEDLAEMPASQREAWVAAVRRALSQPHGRTIPWAIVRRSLVKHRYVEVVVPIGRGRDVILDAATPEALETTILLWLAQPPPPEADRNG